MKLSDEDFIKIIESTPLISIDLIIRNPEGSILMGKRKNQPAFDSWFVPGGRVKKGESVDRAIARIGKMELDVELTRNDGRFVGVFDHLYETNFANIEGIHTQYVVLAYEYYLDFNLKELPFEQHSEWKWFNTSQAKLTHENSAAYFKAIQTVDDVAYSALNARRDAFNNMLWQTPVLSLVAQAFLFTTILSSSTEPGSRTIAALLALITSIASLQLLAKHRNGELDLARELDSIEKTSGRFQVNRYRSQRNWFLKMSSYRIWLGVLSLFGVASIIALLFPCWLIT